MAVSILSILLVLGALVVILPVTIFNSLVRKRNRVKNAFSQIDVQLKRRYDLIPNLIEVARKFMEHERGTLDAVNAELGTSIVVITHNAAIREIAHRVIHFADGRIARIEENARRRAPAEIAW